VKGCKLLLSASEVQLLRTNAPQLIQKQYLVFKFNIHGTVHRNMTSGNYQQDATQLRNLLFHIHQ
jgi:hypothetical protein